jgi:hypothetical protein
VTRPGGVYLIEVDRERAIIADADQGVQYPPFWTVSIAARGYWFDHEDDRALRAKLLALPVEPGPTAATPR